MRLFLDTYELAEDINSTKERLEIYPGRLSVGDLISKLEDWHDALDQSGCPYCDESRQDIAYLEDELCDAVGDFSEWECRHGCRMMKRIWTFIKAYPWTWGIGLSIFLIAAVSVTYAIITRPGDLGFLERNNYELKWKLEDIPIGCFYEETLPTAYVAAYEEARRKYNRAIGREVYGMCGKWMLSTIPSKAPSGNIFLRTREETDDAAHGGRTSHRYDKRSGRLLSADIQIDKVVQDDRELLGKVMLHELGHGLGLDHDREKSSIMYPAGIDRPNDLSSKDEKLLRSTYGE